MITFARKRSPILFDYKIADSLVPRTTSVRELGVQLDRRFTFDDHFELCLSKANHLLNYVLRVAKDFKDPYTLYHCIVLKYDRF